MKTNIDRLSETRVKLTVEVDFEKFGPYVDNAISTLGKNAQIPGFRKGKVPAKLLEKRIGRGAILQEAINDALSPLYREAIETNDLRPLGPPEVDVTEIVDGEKIVFTAETDVRPEITLPEPAEISVTVDAVDTTEEAVEKQLDNLRKRFGTLKDVERAAQTGDFVTLDLVAKIGDEEVDKAAGLSYEVGAGDLVDGLDEAVTGASAGEVKTFTTELAGGPRRGETAEVTVTIQSVKEQELPEVDDDFAQLASEFDTIAELRENIKEGLTRQAQNALVVTAKEKIIDAYVESVEVPLPEAVVESEVASRRENVSRQLERAGLSWEEYLSAESKTEEEFTAELTELSRKAIKTQLVLDTIVDAEEYEVSEGELMGFLVHQSSHANVAPQEFINQVVSAGQIPFMFAEVRRLKATWWILDAAKAQDSNGAEIDLSVLKSDPHHAAVELQQPSAPSAPEGSDTANTAAQEAAAADLAGEVMEIDDLDSVSLFDDSDAEDVESAAAPEAESDVASETEADDQK